MGYTTVGPWTNDSSPYLSDTNLDHIEQGIVDAHLGDTYATENVRYFIPENYTGCDPTGVASSKTAFSTFFADIPNGGVGIIPAGSYMLDGGILDYSLNKSITLDFTGATVTGTGSSSGFSFNGSFGTTYTVSYINTALSTGGQWGNNGENMYYTQITTNAATGWKKGDLVKLVSDDIDNDIDPSATTKSSESMYVLESSGTTVYLRGETRCPYTTPNNIRVAKWSDSRLRIIAGTFQCADTILDGNTMNPVGPLRLQWLAGARVEGLRIKQAAGPGITVNRCYGARIIDYDIDLSYDGSDTQQNIFYGYGVNDSGEYTLVDRMKARRVRHAYTSSGPGYTGSGGTVAEYGKSYGARVTNSECWGATQSSFDTHEGAEHVEFYNCTSYEGYGAFGLRGSYNRITNCRVIGSHHAGCVTMWPYSGSRSNGNVVSGLYVDGCTAGSIISSTGLSGYGDVNYVTDMIVLNRDTGDSVLYAASGTLMYSNVRVNDGAVSTWKSTGTGGVISDMNMITASGTGIVEVDSFSGTDDQKLASAMSYAAAQTYKPTLRLSSRQWTFNSACPTIYKGFKLTGSGDGASVEQPRSDNPYATLVDINTSGTWMTVDARYDGVYIGNMAIRGPATSSSTFMTRSSTGSSGQLATGVMENLGFDAWGHVIGNNSIPMLFTAYNMTGWWNVNNAYGTQMVIGGSDCNLWMEGMLIDTPYTATANPLMILSYLDLSVVGPVYMTASGPYGSAGTSGGLQITSGQQRTITLTGWRIGGRSVADEHQGALIEISGDCTTFISDSWISQTDPAAGGGAAIVEVSGGAKVVLDKCAYKPHTGASASIVWAQVSGSTSYLRVANCFGTTTGYPINVKSVSSGNLVADSSVTNVT